MDNSWIDILITTWSGVLLGVAIAENMEWLGAVAVFFWFTGKPLTLIWENNSLSKTVKKEKELNGV